MSMRFLSLEMTIERYKRDFETHKKNENYMTKMPKKLRQDNQQYLIHTTL